MNIKVFVVCAQIIICGKYVATVAHAVWSVKFL